MHYAQLFVKLPYGLSELKEIKEVIIDGKNKK